MIKHGVIIWAFMYHCKGTSLNAFGLLSTWRIKGKRTLLLFTQRNFKSPNLSKFENMGGVMLIEVSDYDTMRYSVFGFRSSVFGIRYSVFGIRGYA